MANPSQDRPKSREAETEDVRPSGDGRPPRSATEPKGSEGSARNPKLKSDPASGEN